MSKLKIFLAVMVLAVFALAACTASQPVDDVMQNEMGDAAGNMDGEMPDTMSDEMSGEEKSKEVTNEMMEEEGEMNDSSHDTKSEDNQSEVQDTSDAMTGDADTMPTWLDYEFTDAVTGETFSISGYKGKVVLVETMAMWCSNCFKQQVQVRELHSLLGERDDFIGIGIDVDPNEDLLMLAEYVDKNGFDWLYSVAPPEVLAGIQSDLGGQFLNPPSTPIVLFDKNGQPHPLPFGIKSASDLLSFVEQYLN